MKNINKVLHIISLRRFLRLSKNDLYREEFHKDISYLNFDRLRIFSNFMLPFALAQLSFDLFLKDFWQTGQISRFMALDIFLTFIGIIVVYVTNFKRPKSASEIRPWMVYIVYTYLFIQLIWASAISIIETNSAYSFPTYLIGVYSAAVIFIVDGTYFLIILLISMIFLLTGSYITISNYNNLVTQSLVIFTLVILAWITSRVFYNTHLKTFLATKELEKTKNELDNTVQERTSELQLANKQLLNEISERKKYEKFLESEKKKALDADNLKSIFLANMSHEIRTPLNGILGFAELLHNQSIALDKKNRYLDIINLNGQQLLKIMDDILDISMIASNQMKVDRVNFKLSHLFPDIIEFYKGYKQRNSKENIDIIYSPFNVGTDDRIYSDPSRIQQILYNLINNSFKFTEKGFVRLGGKIENGFALIFIEDSGIGIDQHQRKTIFKRFRQGDESLNRGYGGTGLGLSIAKGIVELLGGMIWLDITYTKGSRFSFSLPLCVDEKTTDLPNQQKYFEILRKKRILLVENNYQEFNFLAESFKEQKIINYRTQFSKISTDFTSFNTDLIIVDVSEMMSNLTEIISKIKQHASHAPIYMILPEPIENISDYLNAGCNKVFFRPLNIQYLLVESRDIFKKNYQGNKFIS